MRCHRMQWKHIIRGRGESLHHLLTIRTKFLMLIMVVLLQNLLCFKGVWFALRIFLLFLFLNIFTTIVILKILYLSRFLWFPLKSTSFILVLLILWRLGILLLFYLTQEQLIWWSHWRKHEVRITIATLFLRYKLWLIERGSLCWDISNIFKWCFSFQPSILLI